MKIDIARCLQGMQKMDVRGLPNDARKGLIEEAIALIQANPATAMLKEYLGYKNYAHFGDQRCDCEYGMGPRHGSIVFQVGRQYGFRGELDADCIYFLECLRDFGAWESPERNSYNKPEQMNLANVLHKYQKLTEEIEAYGNALEQASVEAQSIGASTTQAK